MFSFGPGLTAGFGEWFRFTWLAILSLPTVQERVFMLVQVLFGRDAVGWIAGG